MKKQKLQLIIIIVLLVALIAGYFGLRHYNKAEENKEATDTYTALSLDDTAITDIKVTSAESSYELAKEDSTWVLTSDKTVNIDQDMVTTMLSNVNSITANDKIDDVTDYDQYGLKDADISIVLTNSDGSSKTILIGDYCDSESRYYCRIDDDTTVYLVAGALRSAFEKTVADITVSDSASSASSAVASDDAAAGLSALTDSSDNTASSDAAAFSATAGSEE